jgi:hypothetical protein
MARCTTDAGIALTVGDAAVLATIAAHSGTAASPAPDEFRYRPLRGADQALAGPRRPHQRKQRAA